MNKEQKQKQKNRDIVPEKKNQSEYICVLFFPQVIALRQSLSLFIKGILLPHFYAEIQRPVT